MTMAPNEMSESQVKEVIKGLLTSNPLVSTIRSLQKDYRDLIGTEIPFYKFKYNSVEHFLKSIPDTCTVLGTGPFAQVFLVVSEKSHHMNQLVTRQRVNAKGRHSGFSSVGKRPRAPKLPLPKEPRVLDYHSFSPNTSNSSGTASSNTYGLPVCNKPALTNSSINKNLQNKTQIKNSNSSNQNLQLEPQVSKGLDNLLEQQKNGIYGKTEVSRSNIEKWIKASVDPIADNAPYDKYPVTIQTKDDKLNNANFNTAKEEIEEDISHVPKKVQDNLKNLISQFENGIWSSDLPGHYEKMFKKELMFWNYGYTSLIEMCITLKHIFHYVRPGKDDFKLYDKSKPLPATAEKHYTMASYDTGDKTKKIHNHMALPELDWSDFLGQIPDDVFKYGNEIPRQFLPVDAKEESILDVVVVEIYDPSKFWVYLGTSEENTVLDKLMDEIQTFYCKEDNAREYAVPPSLIKEGLYCVQIIFGEYHRAKVVQLYPDNDEYVKLFYIDYGSTCKAPVKGICFLLDRFSSLPAQAIRCRLANIIPTLKGHPWSRSVSERFRQLINRRDTMIKISHIDYGYEFVWVFLADVTDPKKIVYINELLVKENLAVWENQPQENALVLTNFKCKVQNLYLFPSFVELENGWALNASEMFALEDMLVPIYFCIPQYFKREDLSLEDHDIKDFESSFIVSVTQKKQRSFIQTMNVNKLINDQRQANFDYFDELKEEIIDYCKLTNVVQIPTTSVRRIMNENLQLDEQLSCDVEEDVHGDVQEELKSPIKYSKEELLNITNEDYELSENIIKKLEKYNLLESEESSSQKSIIKQEDDKITSPVLPLANPLFGSHELLLTIPESSDEDHITSSKSSSLSVRRPFSLFNLTTNSQSDVNIFDNPEAFENKTSPDSTLPLTPLGFLQNVESKIGNMDLANNDLVTTSPGFLPGFTSKTSANPFKFQSDNLSDFLENLEKDSAAIFSTSICDNFTKPNLMNSLPDMPFINREESSIIDDVISKNKLKELQSPDPFKNGTDDTKNKYIGSFNNPFIYCLESNTKAEASDNEESALIQEEVDPEESFRDSLSVSESESQNSDSDKSDYKVFVPKSKELPASASANPSKSSSSTSIPDDGSQQIERTSSIGNLSSVSSRISLNAAEFQPRYYEQQPQFHPSQPRFVNGACYPPPGFPPRQNFQWSNGVYQPTYAVPYGMPRAQPYVRPPPEFNYPYYQHPNPIQGYQPGPYNMMPQMDSLPPMYSGYNSRMLKTPLIATPPMGYPIPPNINNAYSVPKTERKDFYDLYNEQLLNKVSENKPQ